MWTAAGRLLDGCWTAEALTRLSHLPTERLRLRFRLFLRLLHLHRLQGPVTEPVPASRQGHGR